MLVALVVVALCQTFGASSPLIPNLIIELRDDQPDASNVSAPSLQDYRIRTRFDIIWSCLSTLFICTWIAIHPNIPTRKRSPIWALWKRIRLMIWALIVPELILIWAYKQWAAARYVAKRFKDEGWSATHGHFLIMGGFVLVRDGQETVLDYETFVNGSLAYEVAFPMVKVSEIQDKSRGDFLSKSIAILQSIWFIVECIARGKEGLALTELELVTLALASLNGVMYFLWWDKPLGVKEPIKVYLGNVDPPKKMLQEKAAEDPPLEEMHTFVQTLCHIPLRRLGCFFSRHYRSTVCWCGAVPSAIHSRLSDILSEMSSHRDQVINSDNFPFGDYLWPLYLPLYWIFVLPVILLGTSLFDIAATSTLKPDATHVPTFYAPDTDPSGDTEGMLFFIALPIVATAFGALHLLAWNFQFPSHIEQLLWRIASLTITGIPAVPLAVEIAVGALYIAIGVPLVIFIIAGLLIVEFLDKYDFRLPDWSIELPDIVWDILGGLFLAIEILAWGIWKVIAEPVLTVVSVIIVGILAIVLPTALVGYMAARLVLLSQAVILLREQPASAFYAINWTRFLPHI